jgi:hypothetical protein
MQDDDVAAVLSFLPFFWSWLLMSWSPTIVVAPLDPPRHMVNELLVGIERASCVLLYVSCCILLCLVVSCWFLSCLLSVVLSFFLSCILIVFCLVLCLCLCLCFCLCLCLVLSCCLIFVVLPLSALSFRVRAMI